MEDWSADLNHSMPVIMRGGSCTKPDIRKNYFDLNSWNFQGTEKKAFLNRNSQTSLCLTSIKPSIKCRIFLQAEQAGNLEVLKLLCLGFYCYCSIMKMLNTMRVRLDALLFCLLS